MRTWAVLATCAVLIVVGRLRLAAAPLHGDVCCYALIGHEMTVGGRPLYSDLWERKPPLLYLTFAAVERAVGYGPREITVAAVVAALATLAAAYAAGGANGGPAAGVVAAVLWTAVCADRELTANQPDPEAFINACLTAAVAVLSSPPSVPGGSAAGSSRRSGWRPVVAGGLLAAATFYKHNVALAAVALLVGLVLTTRRIRPAVVAGSVVVATWAAFLGRAYAVGRGPATVDVLFRQNAAYSGAGSFAANLLGGLAPGRLAPAFLLAALGPMLLVIAFAVPRRTDRGPGPAWGLWLAWAVGTWATVSLTGMVYPHYYQLWLPVACVGGGWAAAGLGRTAWGRIVVAVVLLGVVARQGWQFAQSPAGWVHDQFDYSVAHQNQMAQWLDANAAGQRFWELGNDNNLYFLTRRDPPSGLLFVDPLLYGTDTAAAWRRLLADLDRRPPAVVILSSDWLMFFDLPRTPLAPWLRQHYAPWQTVRFADGPDRPTAYTLFRRRD